MNEVVRCQAVISQSLHGLIVADAMEIPNVWLEPTRAMVGGPYKFHDYFTTVSGDTASFPLARLDDEDPPRSAYGVRQYRFDKDQLLTALVSAIRTGI